MGPFARFHDNAYILFLLPDFLGAFVYSRCGCDCYNTGSHLHWVAWTFAVDSRHQQTRKVVSIDARIWFINFSMFNFSDFFENTMTALAREASPDCTYLIPLAWLANLFSISATWDWAFLSSLNLTIHNLPRFRVSSKHVAGSISEGFKKPMAL